jgi:hypothetical protein
MSWIDSYLERLEVLIDVEHVKRAERLQEAAWKYEDVDRLPLLVSLSDKVSKKRKGTTDWPTYPYSEIFYDKEKMLLDELSFIYEGALIGDDKMYTIRANYGIGIIPSLFGCSVSVEGENMPWVGHLESWDEVKQAIANGVPDLNGGLMRRVSETEAFFREALSPYPKLRETVHIHVCDTQGPFNIAAEVLGPRIYTDIYDEPQMLHELLEVVTETYIAVTKAEKDALEEDYVSGYHWHYRLCGGARIAEDFALSISPRAYEEFVKPYNERAFAPFQGGYILYCGQGPQVLDLILSTKGVNGILVWSERVEDLLTIYEKAKPRGVAVLWMGPLPSPLKLDTGVILEQVVSSVEEGRALMESIQRNG